MFFFIIIIVNYYWYIIVIICFLFLIVLSIVLWKWWKTKDFSHSGRSVKQAASSRRIHLFNHICLWVQSGSACSARSCFFLYALFCTCSSATLYLHIITGMVFELNLYIFHFSRGLVHSWSRSVHTLSSRLSSWISWSFWPPRLNAYTYIPHPTRYILSATNKSKHGEMCFNLLDTFFFVSTTFFTIECVFILFEKWKLLCV